MRKPVIAGNWKMYKTPSEARDLVEALKPLLAGQEKVEAVICPPFTALETVNNLLQGSAIGLGAQDVHWEKEGAFTGEVSPSMLAAVGCRYVIIGHSERRQYFGETDETVNKKVKAAIAAGLIPLVCVGETLAQREAGETEQVCRTQVQGGLAGLSAPQVAAMVIAYEPVWAIGTGRTASAADAQEVIAGIRGVVAGMYGKEAADSLRIQYGGSVKPENIAELMAQPDIDGALVGGASLKAESFAKIVKYK